MKFLLLLTLASCGLLKPRPTHPDVKRFSLAGHWTNERRGELRISCSGDFDLSDPHEVFLSLRHTSVSSDIRRVSENRIVLAGFLLNEIDDFTPPVSSGQGRRMYLNESEWVTSGTSECP